jgi:acetyl-CoA/propionyl-CoA carboxylase biotin carboxyl carrier protein
MFERVLIANRGEVVVRVARTLRALGCSPATVHTHDDPARAHVRAADLAVEVPSYLDVEAIVAAALAVGAQAIHPGYGFLAESPQLAAATAAAGLAWIGPPAEAIALMGDKAAAREAAARARVPVLAGAAGEDAALIAFAREHGPPVIVKAVAGGGGKGMRVVRSLEELEGALEAARREARSAFGDGALLIERLISPARHVEVQVLADSHGGVISLGARECSLQRRHQKVIEEAPALAAPAGIEGDAVALARACGYVGAGTVEFVVSEGAHHFLEMNTRLQVEHAVTEEIFGIDLVEWQLRIAAGEALPEPGAPRGHAIEARVYAEDPSHAFLPSAGRLLVLELPDSVRVDCGVAEGETIGTRYDPMIAKLTASAPTREQARLRLVAALRATTILGVRTNVAYLCALLEDERVRAGDLDTALAEQLAAPEEGDGARRAALVAALAPGPDDEDPFARLGAWRLLGAGARPEAVLLGVEALRGGQRLLVDFDGVAQSWVLAGEWVGHGGESWELVAPSGEAAAPDAERELRAPMPGAVVAVPCSEGDEVTRGDVLVVLESMKMELQITAPADGVLDALHVAAGDQVALGDVLAHVEPR